MAVQQALATIIYTGDNPLEKQRTQRWNITYDDAVETWNDVANQVFNLMEDIAAITDAGLKARVTFEINSAVRLLPVVGGSSVNNAGIYSFQLADNSGGVSDKVGARRFYAPKLSLYNTSDGTGVVTDPANQQIANRLGETLQIGAVTYARQEISDGQWVTSLNSMEHASKV